MLFGMNLAQAISPSTAAPVANTMAPIEQARGRTIDEQIETVRKLKDLVDAGVLSQDEFDAKKKQVMGL